MEVKILVTVKVEPDDGVEFSGHDFRVRCAALEAVENAVNHSHYNGFNHKLSDVVSIHVVDVCLHNGVTKRDLVAETIAAIAMLPSKLTKEDKLSIIDKLLSWNEEVSV